MQSREKPTVKHGVHLDGALDAEPDRRRSASAALYDLGTECGVLGALLLHPYHLSEAIAAGLVATAFAGPGHAAVFEALVRIAPDPDGPPPVLALFTELHRAGDLPLWGRNGHRVVDLLVEALAPSLVLPAVERLLMLASARKVEVALCEARVALMRNPGAAGVVLTRLQGVR